MSGRKQQSGKQQTRNQTRNRSEEDKEKVFNAMLEAAGEILVAEGYDKLTLAKVGKAVGFSTTNVYRYFDSKDDLIYEAIKSSFVVFGQRMEAAYHQSDEPMEKVIAIGHAYLDFAKEYPVAYNLMFVQKSDYLFVEREVPVVDKISYMVMALSEGMAAGTIRQGNLPAMANSLWMMVHGIATIADTMVFVTEKDRGEAIEEAFKTAMRGLQPT